MKSIYKHYWQENLVWLGFSDDQITKFLSFIPDSFYELHADFYAATKDHTKLIVNLVPGYQPNPSEIKGDLYLIDINGTIKNYEINLNGWGRQETQISRNKELMGIRLPLIGDRESLFVFSLIDGAMANITPNINEAYGIRFSPDSRQVAYYSDQGIWISSVDGKDQKLVIKNPELSLWTPDGKGAKNVDWSPDGKELVFLMDDSLHISTVDGTNITELLDQNGRNFTDANYPEWVQANGKRQIIYQTLENEWGLIDLETGKNRMFGNWKGRSLYRFPSRWLDWSPDGKWFRGSYDDDKNNIYKDYLCSIESVTCKSIYSLDCNGSEREGGNCYCLWR